LTKTATLTVPTSEQIVDASLDPATPYSWSIAGPNGFSASPSTTDPTVALPGLEEGVTYSDMVTKLGFSTSFSFVVPTDAPPPPPPPPATQTITTVDTSALVAVTFS
jgi:hypothetical protein